MENIVIDTDSFEITYTLKSSITKQNISDILVTAFEGGITYWSNKCVDVHEWPNKPGTNQRVDFASDVVAEGASVFIYEEEEDVWHELTLANLLDAIVWYLENYQIYQEPGDKSLNEMLEYMDAEIADSIVQVALFGKVVYG